MHWIKHGIRIERSRPGCPQDNGAHERMHRTLKDCTARPPAANLRAQQGRFYRFRREYNELRPHESIEDR
ncbi:integrase core domain-containing protein, partial [Salmonella enterica]|uniref:integrase core domain-containing protein n=1 Tax=Salmonella enterica TaxID=28901 RepID=UPI003D768E18